MDNVLEPLLEDKGTTENLFYFIYMCISLLIGDSPIPQGFEPIQSGDKT